MSSSTGTVESSPPNGLFSSYAPPPGVYDELREADGRLRNPWVRLAGGLSEIGPQGLAQRWEQARRLLRENGVTYNVHGAPEGPDRPWELDPIPLLLAKSEWETLAAALTQRVTLLNRILVDLYGPQELLSSGLLPPKLVLGHSGFLLPCHGIPVPQNTYIHMYGSHLARGPDGRWIALADRTQGPSGAGYAVENRIVISRTLPTDFHSLHVERLAAFFMQLRRTLQSLALGHRENPRVVLLSPGPRSNTYFEDAYLARYLGYTLVEGGDLTVRNTSVFLKTLGGLLPVDVILRRVRDEECDPLELRAESYLGVPGLVQAARSGQVVIANALGSGLLEAPALAAFLPEICKRLLGEELKLPSVPTWWCGRDEDRRYVESHLDELVIRPALLHRSAAPILGSRLSAREREDLLNTIRDRPADFAAQEHIVCSTAPVWTGGSLPPFHVWLRAFAVSSGNGGYEVMPGGLSRVSTNSDSLGESIAAGQASKDVWILSDQPVTSVTLLNSSATAIELRRSPNDLPSRVADHLYWLGRQVERAEGMVRHLRSAVVRMTNELEPAGMAELAVLVHALYDETEKVDVLPVAETEETLALLQADVLSFIFTQDRPHALYRTLQGLHSSASVVRDRISIDSWRIVNQIDLDLLFPWPPERARLGEVLLLLNQMLSLLAAFSGLGTESMTRGPGWRFLDMGRRLERAQHTLRLLRRTLVVGTGDLIPLLEALLEVADSSMTYRYRYLTSLQLAPVLDLLLADETNPRSVGFQLSALSEHVRLLPSKEADPIRNQEQRIMLAAQASLRLVDVEALCEADSHHRRTRLDRFLERISHQLFQLSESISHTYLTHTGPSRQLANIAPVSQE